MTAVTSPSPAATRSPARTLGVIGVGLGVTAGLIQLLAGSAIPQWSGNKTDNAALGLTTVILILVAAAGLWQLRHNQTRWQRIAALLLVLACAGVCFTTVGRLWYIPGPVLIAAAVLTFTAAPSAATSVPAEPAAFENEAGPGARGWLAYTVGVLLGLGLALSALFTVLLGTYASSVAVAAAVAIVAGLTLSIGVAPALRRRAVAMLTGGLGAGLMAGGIVLAASAVLITLG